MNNMIPYLNEAFILGSACSMLLGWWQIRKHRIQSHKKFMILGTVLAVLFFAGYAIKTVVIGDATFGGPARLNGPYQLFLQVHSVLATLSAILGILVLRFVRERQFSKHKKIGPWTVTFWMITTGSGLAVFLLLYLIYPAGPTRNLFQAWLGA